MPPEATQTKNLIHPNVLYTQHCPNSNLNHCINEWSGCNDVHYTVQYMSGTKKAYTVTAVTGSRFCAEILINFGTVYHRLGLCRKRISCYHSFSKQQTENTISNNFANRHGLFSISAQYQIYSLRRYSAAYL